MVVAAVVVAAVVVAVDAEANPQLIRPYSPLKLFALYHLIIFKLNLKNNEGVKDSSVGWSRVVDCFKRFKYINLKINLRGSSPLLAA